MPSFEINIRSSDDPSGIQSATAETQKYTDAVGRALLADKKRAENRAAREAIVSMSDAEKQAAVAAYDLAIKQELANASMVQTDGAAGAATNTIMNVRNAWMEAAAVIQVAQTAVQAGQQIYSETLGRLIDYGEKIRDITQLSGVSAEQASRLYQVADDLEISYDQLATSMEQAAKRGFVPTIENLAELADRYVALSDQQAKNKLVFDELGRSGMELVNMLELGGGRLLELNSNVEQSLILNGLQVEQIKTLVKSQDDFNDQIEIQKLMIGERLRPVLQYFLDLNTAYLEVTKGEKSALELLIPLWPQLRMVIEGASSAIGAHNIGVARSTALANENADAVNDQGEALQRTGNYYKDYMANFAASHPDYRPGQAYIPGRASGGSVDSGRAYWVGEAGPEIFVPKSDGYITSNQAASGAVRGGDTYNVSLNVSSIIPLSSQAEAEQMLIPIIQRALRKV